MAVHVFVISEENFIICVRKGLAGIPNSSKNPNTNDGLISRLSLVKKDDLILFYVIGKKELHGVFRVLELPFFDEMPVWGVNDDGQCYPFRVRFDNSDFNFTEPIKLSDIYDLKDNGLIWTFSLKRPSSTTTNAMFSITNNEYRELLRLFLKINPIYSRPKQIREPYPYFEPNIMQKLTIDSDFKPKYEYTVMSLIMYGLASGKYKDIFGNYSDFLGYVPTSFEREIDILLIFDSPINPGNTIAYNLIEVKRDEFDEKGLAQLLQYEDWFLKKKVNGDYKMIRTTAIANSFSIEVKNYLAKRFKYEGKRVMLIKYQNTSNGLQLFEEKY